ncbi:ATP-binding protein [Piscinibacter sp.]|uniref:ATP-binding protein n=1 Tax=Piscinibacter sp. TaxID=1903157 RepID=UPI002B96932F|nr:AAA family ATPase [Albitalea sp.]HUG25278.1 AAA family ATPase [Albitalea sp.]
MEHGFQRPIAAKLKARLSERPRLIQILAGPRQVGKTTLVSQVLSERPPASFRMIAADPQALPEAATPTTTAMSERHVPPSPEWLQAQWALAIERAIGWEESGHAARTQSPQPFVLVVDEIQKVEQWSSLVKGLWDADRTRGTPMHVVLLGSAPLLMQQGLSESLMGRYELVRMGQWSFAEMNEAFDMTLDQYVHFGGYPGSAPLIEDEVRWREYVRNAILEPSIDRDVLAMTRVDRPALLRQLFELGCAYSGQILSLDKASGMLGRGHTQTLADHLTRLSQAGLLSGLHKYAGQVVRQRASPPKFQVHDNALMTAMSSYGFDEARMDRSHWGRQVESIVGAHLLNTADADTKLFYWNERDKEVDYIVEHRGRLAAIEVKLAATTDTHPGLQEFCRRHPTAKPWLIGSEALPLGEFLQQPASFWTR